MDREPLQPRILPWWGGYIPPYLRKAQLSSRGRRLSGALLAIWGLMTLEAPLLIGGTLEIVYDVAL